MRMIDGYHLDDNGCPVKGLKVQSIEQRRAGLTKVKDCEISTVFIYVDHSRDGYGAPVLWETMVFGGPIDGDIERCSGNKKQAEAMHEMVVNRVKSAYATQ